MTRYRACVTWRELKSTCLDQIMMCVQTTRRRAMDIALMRMHTPGHNIICCIIYTGLEVVAIQFLTPVFQLISGLILSQSFMC